MKDINNWTIEEFRSLSDREWNEDIGLFDSLIILPSEISNLDNIKYRIQFYLNKWFPCLFRKPEVYEVGGLHDSGYRQLDFIAVKKNIPICKLSGYSDVIHIDGVGGLGIHWYERFHKCPDSIVPKGWNMDCLPRSGLLRLWCSYPLRVGLALSSFEIYGDEREKRNE